MDTNDTHKEDDLNMSDFKRRVVIPIDASEHCLRAFNWYIDHLRKDGDLLIFIHVVEPVFQPHVYSVLDMPFVFSDSYSKIMEDNVKVGKKLCKDYMKNARKYSVKGKAFIHIDNDPGKAIVDACIVNKADMIVMGNRGIGAIRRTFMGSVSEYILHHARIPVAIISPSATPATNANKEQ